MASRLRSVADPAVERGNAQVGHARQISDGGFHLHGEFPGRLKDKTTERAVSAEVLQKGQREGGSLSRACLGRSDNIAAFQRGRYRAELNRRRIAVAHGLNPAQKWPGQSKLGKWHVIFVNGEARCECLLCQRGFLKDIGNEALHLPAGGPD
jgi:hypothetical protein